ncbi:acyltransferase family protein [Chamaesiphon sp.]|uniref:acyltransferase family protein n=1 Tax=Chamaesiphon sp. TaxID=2814140 RepID=UPI0035947E08
MKRIKSLDTVRGMLMLHIVLIIHGIYWLVDKPHWTSSVLLFEMPAIFIVSGYSYYISENLRANKKSATMSAKAYFEYLTSRLTRILVPYFIYAMTCSGLLYILSLHKDYGLASNDLGKLFIAWANPLNYGNGFSLGLLNAHLWFIPVFLIVTALMPIATMFRPLKNPNILSLIALIFLGEYILYKTNFFSKSVIIQSMFYLIFSLLGYYMARNKNYFKSTNFFNVSIFLGFFLVFVVIIKGDLHAMNMQANKFPPNHIFFLFSCFWISIFLSIIYRFSKFAEKLEEYYDSLFLKPFITSGYSIYLWQGLGYTIAVWAGKSFDLPMFYVWVLAVSLSIVFGTFMAPFEKIRFSLSPSKQE